MLARFFDYWNFKWQLIEFQGSYRYSWEIESQILFFFLYALSTRLRKQSIFLAPAQILLWAENIGPFNLGYIEANVLQFSFQPRL